MSVTHESAIRNGIADYVVDSIDVGGTGTLQFLTSGDAALATLTFSATAFGAAAAGVATAAAITSESSATAGVTTKGIIRNGSAVTILNFAVATSGSDVNISSTTFSNGDQIALTSLTYTAPN